MFYLLNFEVERKGCLLDSRTAVKIKGKRYSRHLGFGCRRMPSNCSVSRLQYNQGATPGGFTFPTRRGNSWYPFYRPRPGLEPTTTKSLNRPLLESNPRPRDLESNALLLTLPAATINRSAVPLPIY